MWITRLMWSSHSCSSNLRCLVDQRYSALDKILTWITYYKGLLRWWLCWVWIVYLYWSKSGYYSTIFDLQFNSVQSLICVWLFAFPWISARQASLPITNSPSLLKLMSIDSVMLSSHLILCRPLLLLPSSVSASGSFPMSQLFAWGGQSTGVSASASVLAMNTQDWSPLGWAGWISL